MKAVLLCAGFGTRMYPLTKDRAKPLLLVGEKPIVGRLVDQLDATWSFDEIIVVCNQRFHDQFVEWGDARVTLLNDGTTDEENRLGAVRDLAWAVDQRHIREPVLVAAGDNLFKDALDPFVADYRQRPRNLISRYREPDPNALRRTGVAVVARDGRLERLDEKPDNPASEWACPALYFLETNALNALEAYLTEAPDADALGSFISWLASRVEIYTHEMQGSRLDVGDLEGYARAESWLENGV